MAENGNLSFSDLLAFRNTNDGGFGSNGSWGWLILIFLFFMGFGGGNLFGNRGVNVDPSTSAEVTSLSSKIDTNVLLDAIRGNSASISALANTLGVNVQQIEQAIGNVRSAVEQASAQTNLSVCQLGNAIERGDANIISVIQNCCCTMKTEMLQSFNSLDKTLCQMQFNNQTSLNTINQGVANGFLQTANILNQVKAEIINDNAKQTQVLLDTLSANRYNDLLEKYNSAQTALTVSNQTQTILNAINSGCCRSSCC